VKRLLRALVALVALAVVLGTSRPALAHVGSPDVFLEGDAGPHHVFIAVRLPQVIPGVATIELRSPSDLDRVTVVPMTLTGPGSEHPPTADVADRSSADPHLFTANLWLMERGSLQVRVAASGPKGSGTLAVPVPASAQRLLPMSTGLAAVLFGAMLLLAAGLVGIAGGAAREVTLEPGALPDARRKRRATLTMAIAALAALGVITLGNAWWSSEAKIEANLIARPWRIQPRVEGCRLIVAHFSPQWRPTLLLDHGHEMHLFVVRTPGFDRLAHLHPERSLDDDFVVQLPSLPAGHYRLFADIVVSSGYPVTGTAEVELPDLDCPAPTGDDSAWAGTPANGVANLEDGARMLFDAGPLAADVAMPLRFRVVDRDGRPADDLEPYMGMAGHAAVVKRDLSVFAHLHPNGSVAMPALELANGGARAHGAHHHEAVPPEVSFPYGFPTAGDYTIFVQVKRAGRVETGAFAVHVDPGDPGRRVASP
jgi:hypothetical protein